MRPEDRDVDVLAHDYGDIRWERLWVLVNEHLPAPVAQLGALVPSTPDDR
jgi:uncharacterized protein with HEPN domain